ncbi:MAG: putative SnoaL-like aldol condensation-catalyzing enzyme [Polaribacter sp.]|jgi:predicted SnoaL-like aldol condensation-catalyzing enzyme
MKTIIQSIFLILILLASNAMAQTSEETQNLQAMDRWVEIWNNGKYELMAETVTPTYIRHEPKGNRVITRDKYLEEIKFYREKLNMRFVNHKVSADKDLIWLLWTMTTTNPKTGKEQLGRGVQLYRLEDGKLAETWWMGTVDKGAWPQ